MVFGLSSGNSSLGYSETSLADMSAIPSILLSNIHHVDASRAIL